MILVQSNLPSDGVLEYNRKVSDDSFRRGDFTLYFDVFEDGDLLFCSYSDRETVQDWRARNTEIETARTNPWLRGIDLSRWAIPRPAEKPRTLSLTEVVLIMNTNFDIALNGREPGSGLIRPNANNVRQLLHYHPSPWAVRWMVDNDNGVMLRACIAHRLTETFDTPRDLDAG